ncbi:MAG: type I-C CRISPR-associated protein Cas8c/Csd1, partial [Eubacteriales bacterium]
NDKHYDYCGVPSVYEITNCIYGVENNKTLSLISRDGKIQPLINMYKRLTPSIIDGSPLPRDIMLAAYNRAINPLAFKTQYERILRTACSLTKKYYGGIKMELDFNNSDRSYLYGRRLAVAYAVEKKILKDRQEERPTNAERYMNMFARRPAHTWKTIRLNIQYCFDSCAEKQKNYYYKLLEEISIPEDYEDFCSDKPLDARFLCGYDCEKRYIYKSKEEKNKIAEENK